MTMTGDDSCWAISDGAAGNERQVMALARALGLTPRVIRIDIAEPWATLAPRLTWLARSAIRSQDGEPLQAPWPRLAIGCGRRAALLTRLLRDWSSGSTYTVQILDPRIPSDHFDSVITPQHDALDGTNVIRTIGALNPVDEQWLADGRVRHPRLGELVGPRTGVLIGASNRAQRIDARYCADLVDHCKAAHERDGGSFMVTVSRRTPAAINAQLRRDFDSLPGIYWGGDDDGVNPYAGILAWADRLIVTPDSVNMISEACATGRPVWTYAPQPIEGKLARLHAELFGAGQLRRIGEPATMQDVPPLRETAAVAELLDLRMRGDVSDRS